jgi:hypothetical protein
MNRRCAKNEKIISALRSNFKQQQRHGVFAERTSSQLCFSFAQSKDK